MHAGVLRTEVHPTAGRVAVVGDVDAGRLVNRLAKVGKIAEVIVVAQPSPEVERRRRDVGGGKKEASPDNGKMGGGTAPKHGGADDDKRGETNGGAGSGASSARIHGGGDDDVKAAMCCYHRAEPPAMAVPVLQPPYYAANFTMPPPQPPAAAYGFGGCYHGTPSPAMAPCRRGRIPVVRPQPTRFADECCMYGDDDIAGCHVM